MKFGIDRLSEDVALAAGASIRMVHDSYLAQIECSPIEALFYAAFAAQTELSEIVLPFRRERPRLTPEEALSVILKRPMGDISLFPQAQFPAWRVDFLIGIRNDEESAKWLIVECDGHDYHERTKEQAARDRSRDREFQAKGYMVFRFTGSELYRSPLEKAGEAFKWLLHQVQPYAP